MRTLSNSSMWLAATLSSEGLVTSLSPGAEQLTGYSAPELAGRPVSTILGEPSAYEIPRIMNAARECGQWEGPIVYRIREGSNIEARGIVSRLGGAGNDGDGFLVLSDFRDRSPAVNDNAEGGGAALTEVADTLRSYAHEMNNPLAVMMGFTQLLLLNRQCQGILRSDIDKLYSELKRVIMTVEQLHEYARSLCWNAPDEKLRRGA
jgi:PAS domain S-box-containing protein